MRSIRDNSLRRTGCSWGIDRGPVYQSGLCPDWDCQSPVLIIKDSIKGEDGVLTRQSRLAV